MKNRGMKFVGFLEKKLTSHSSPRVKLVKPGTRAFPTPENDNNELWGKTEYPRWAPDSVKSKVITNSY